MAKEQRPLAQISETEFSVVALGNFRIGNDSSCIYIFAIGPNPQKKFVFETTLAVKSAK